jgi:MFS family permease
MCTGSVGVALSNAVPELMIWRFLQAFGASAGLSVGSGVIADIYKLEERGTAMGVFYGVSYWRLVMIDILTLCNS